MRVPRATYRLQFNEHFRLTDGTALVPYLHDLGVSHIYASPVFKASPHSTHGYDVCDYGQLNPELGTEDDLEKLAQALHSRKMGLVLDLVPNHMGVTSSENSWWWDVLANGTKSRYASYFDIDWKGSDNSMQGKVLVPVLGGDYETILNNGELQVIEEAGHLVVGYHEHRFPLSPGSLRGNGDALSQIKSDTTALDELLRRQNYRLVHHEQGDKQLNYRRFFAVAGLAGVRVEDEDVFAATHALLHRWLKRGWVDGLRVDHPDGLRDPAAYLQRLRALAPDAWIVVEKILEPRETLPADWPAQGTTGYDFLNQVNGVLVDDSSAAELSSFYDRFTGEAADYPALLIEKKKDVQDTLLASELNRLCSLLIAAAVRRTGSKGFARDRFKECLKEVIACFPVYRSYITERDAASVNDTVVVKFATQLACEKRPDLPAEIFATIHSLLLQPQRTAAVRDFVARFQQLTGAVMAKGAEDTAFYWFNRFASLNEVGGNPEKFGVTLEEFHHFLKEQCAKWPHSQLTTSTHDTKRAEDVRARLNLLSEIPDRWIQAVERWSAMNACHREGDFPDRNAEYLYYQTLVGAWPIPVERAQAYMEKAVHEARRHTSWTNRNEPYEKALQKFVAETLRDPQFTTDLEHFVNELAEAAAVNSLTQTLLKLSAPGVPDIYQGCELWDFSLVDPDNRRPVIFKLRQELLASASSQTPEQVWNQRASGLPKMWLIQKALRLRGGIPDFATLNYLPVFATGAKASHVIAFSRGGRVMAVAPRFPLKLNRDWADTQIELPAGSWRNELTGETVSGKINLAGLLKNFPVALLARKENG
jgi:(1->4)-alpha-D-glucan 1-alpha-D-glucosylmutase